MKYNIIKLISGKVSRCLAFVILGSGCNTFTKGNYEMVLVTSKPSNAEVWVGNNYVGRTPLEIDLSRSISHQILLFKEGYHAYSVEILMQVLQRKFKPNPVAAKLIPK